MYLSGDPHDLISWGVHRLVVLLGLVAACGFQSSAKLDAGGGGSGDASAVDAIAVDGVAVIDAAPDGPPACWPFAVTNFDPCSLPVVSDLTTFLATGASLNTDAPPGGITVGDVTQSNGTHLAIIHVTNLTVANAIGVTGNRLLVIAADGDVTISGSIQTNTGAGLACTGIAGNVGGDSAVSGAAGGAGGAGGATVGGVGGDGGGVGAGAGGPHGNAVAATNPSLIAPLHGGCGGATGGAYRGNGGGGGGGGAGGALQITAKGTISLGTGASLLAYGFGGGGAKPAGGGGSGGSGGAILLESTHLAIGNSAVVCADGGAGGQGGGAASSGGDGGQGACTGLAGAATVPAANGGSLGGTGGWKSAAGAGGSTGGGGGGGGGAAGFVRFHTVNLAAINNLAVVTPTPFPN